MVKPIKRKRKMTEEQRAAAAERLAKARAARGPSKNLSVHESMLQSQNKSVRFFRGNLLASHRR